MSYQDEETEEIRELSLVLAATGAVVAGLAGAAIVAYFYGITKQNIK